MMSMDISDAVRAYQYGERAKSELLMLSQLLTVAGDLPDTERAGGKRILLIAMELVRTETEFAYRATTLQDFQRSVNSISDAISLTESNDFLGASLRIGASISAATTAAQNGWQVLNEHGLL